MRKLFSAVITMLIFLSPVFASPASADFPSLEPYVIARMSDNPTPEEIMKTALTLSEYPAVNVEPYMEKYREIEKQLRTRDFLPLSEEERADYILKIMYDYVLLSYYKPQTRLTAAFDTGVYNCVSSAILYYCLAKSAGIEVYANRVPDHCFCTVIINGKHIDVETTNPMGFNPGQKKQISSSKSGTKYAIMPKKIYNGRQTISARMLVSLVPQNIISYNISTNDYATFVPVAATRRAFLYGGNERETSDGVQVFEVVATNYNALLIRSKRYTDSMYWMDAVIERWGMSEGLKSDYEDAVFNAVLVSCEQKDFDKAESDFNARKSNLSTKSQKEIENVIFLYETNAKSMSLGSDEKAVAYLKEQMKNPLAQDAQIKKQLTGLLENAWIRRLNAESKKSGFLECAMLSKKALEDLPQSQKIKHYHQQSLNNYAVDVHNEYAKLANSGQYEKAMEVLKKGLETVPGNQRLQSDMTQLKKIMKQ